MLFKVLAGCVDVGFPKDSQQIWKSNDDVSADLSHFTFLDSSGVGALLSLYKRLPRAKASSSFACSETRPGVIEFWMNRIFDVEGDSCCRTNLSSGGRSLSVRTERQITRNPWRFSTGSSIHPAIRRPDTATACSWRL